MRRTAWAAIAALFIWSGAAEAQMVRRDGIVLNPQGRPVPNATVRVCTGSAATPEPVPCSPQATVYTAPDGLTVKASVTSDAFGNYWYYAPAGTYKEQITGSGIAISTVPDIPIVGPVTGTQWADGGFVTVGTTGGTVTPTASAVALAQESTTGGAIADGTYYCVTTLVNLNGETTPTPEASIAIAAGTGTAQLRAVLTGNEWMTGAFGYKLYCGTVSGGPYFLQTPRTWTSTMNADTVNRDANDFVTLTLTGTASLGLGVGYDITVAGATGCTDNPNGSFKVYSHTAVASPASSSVTFKHAGATESGCGGAAITVTWTAPGVFSAANVGAATHLIGAHLARGNTILTSIVGSGANPPSTNTAAIDDVQVAINSARVASSLVAGQAPKVEKTVQLAEGNDQISGGKFFYGITTPLILSDSDRLVGNATTVLDSTTATGTLLWARASGTGAGVNALWDDVYDRIGVVMIMNTGGALLKDVNVDADGTHAVMLYQSEGDAESSSNIRLLNGTWRTVGAGANCPAPLRTMARIYYLTVDGVDLVPATTTDCFATSGHPRAAAVMMSHGAGSEWVFKGPVRWTVPAKHDFIQNRMGPTDPDRGVNRSGFSQRNHLVLQNMGHFQATAGGGTGVICRCENVILNSVSSPGPADYNVSAGTDAAYIFGANSYGAGGAQTFYKASLLSTANNAATVKFTNSTDRLELLNSTIGGSSTLVDFNNFSVPFFALFSGPSDLCDPRASYFANRVTTPGSGSNHFLCLGSLASNTADRREGPHMYVMGGIVQQGFNTTLANAREWCIVRENSTFKDCYYKDPDTTAQRYSSVNLTNGVTQFYGVDGTTVILEVDKANDLLQAGNLNNILFVDGVKYATIAQAQTALLASNVYGGTIYYTPAPGAPVVIAGFTIEPGVTVVLGPGLYGLTSKIRIKSEGHLRGSGPSTNSAVGTTLRPDGTQNIGTLVESYETTGANWWHNASIENLAIDGVKATNSGNGIHIYQMGQSSAIRDVYIHDTAGSAFYINGESVPAHLENLSAFASDAYGFDFDFAKGSDVGGNAFACYTCTGDANASGLFYLRNAGYRTTVSLFNTKSERITNATYHDPVIQLDDFDATLNLVGFHAYSDPAFAAATRVIRLVNGSDARINLVGASQNLYTNWLENGAQLFPTYGGNFLVNFVYNTGYSLIHQNNGNLDITVPLMQVSNRMDVRRIHSSGTALVAGDFALSAGCGSTASVSAVTSNSRDQTFEFDLTSAGTGQGANTCTVTFTFTDGTFTNAPFLTCNRNDLVATAGTIAHTTKSATAPVLTFKGTPVAGDVYKIACNFVGN